MAASWSASAKTMFGFFPPSSSETFLNIGAHVSATLRPVTVPPVNEIVPIFGCAVISEPTFGPVPWTMLRTPFGRPASRQTSQSRYAVIGVSSLGFEIALGQIDDAQENARSIRRRRARPIRECFFRGDDGQLDIARIAIRNLRIRFARRRLDVVEIFSAKRRKELAVDEVADLKWFV